MTQTKAIDDLLTHKKLLLVTGKGGIGKTLVSCALASRAVALGRRVLIVEQAAVEQIGPLLGIAGVTHEEKWSGQLGVANFTPGGNFKDFITKHLMKSNLLDVIVSNKVVHSFFTAIPGFSELMLLGRIFYALNLAPRERPDLVILDGYASGHFLSLMTTPDAVLKSGLAGPILQQTKLVKDWLADAEQCASLYVAVPEDLVISEAIEFLPVLASKSPTRLGAVVMNRCLRHVDAAGTESHSSAFEFARGRETRQSLALEKYAKGMSGLKDLNHLPVFLLPELGDIDEPLTEATVDKLLGGPR